MLVFLLAGCGFQPFSENDLNWAINQLIPPNSKIISIHSRGSGFNPHEYITGRINMPDGMAKSDFQEWEQKTLEKKGWKIQYADSYTIKFNNQGALVSFSFEKSTSRVLIQITLSTKEKTYNNIRDYF